MAEQLGEAVLVLRTDDRGLDRGIAGAKGKSQDLGRTLDATSGSATRLTKTLDDAGNAAGTAGAKTGEYSNDVRRLKAAIDPAWGALQKFKEQAQLARQALDQGAISHKQYVQHMRDSAVAAGLLSEAGNRVTMMAGAQRAGTQQLVMNISDMTTMYSLGARASQIFASQIGQVVQAIMLMSNGTSKFAAFMGSGWGMAITAAAMVLLPLVGHLLESGDAADEATKSHQTLADQLDRTKNSYDDVKKALLAYNAEQKKSNETTLEAAQVAAARAKSLLAEAIAIRQRNKALLDASYDQMDSPRSAEDAQGAAISTTLLQRRVASNDAEIELLKQAQRDANAGLATERAKVASDPIAGIRERFDKLRDAARASIPDVDKLTKRLTELNVQEEAATKKARDDKSGATGRREDAAAKRAQRAAEEQARHDEAYNRDLAGLAKDAMQIRQQMADTIEERYQIERQALDQAIAEQRRRITDNRDYSQAQKAALLAQLEIKAGLERELIESRRREEIARQALEVAQAMRSNEIDLLQKGSRLAETREERRAIELRILDLTYEQEKAQLEAVLASRDATEAQKKIAEARLDVLGQLKSGDQAAIEREYESPMQRYLRELNGVGRNINDQMENVAVHGLQTLEDRLTQVVMRTKSLGGAFKDVANQIIAEMTRIALQRNVIGPIANLLFGGGMMSGDDFLSSQLGGGGGGGGGGLFGKLLGGLFGGGGGGGGGGLGSLFGGFFGASQRGGSVFASGGMSSADDFLSSSLGGGGGGLFSSLGSLFSGGHADGGLIPSGTFGIVGERGPEPVIATSAGAKVLPNSSLRGNSGGAYFDLRGAVTTQDLLNQMNSISRSHAAAAIGSYDGVVGDRVKENLARRG